MLNEPFYCPACKTKLVQGANESYETLDEHVCCPNREGSSLRPTLVCPNQACIAYIDKVFWEPFFGDGPYSDVWHKDGTIWIDANPHPFNSPARSIYFQVHYHLEDKVYNLTKRIKIKKEIRYISNDFGDKTRKNTHYKIIKDNIYYTSGIRMFVFDIKSFYKRRKLNKSEGEELVERSKWPNAQWWRKASALWIKTFHSKDLKST